MSPFFKIAFIITLCSFVTHTVDAQTENMVTVRGGTYIPLYGTDSTSVTIADFSIDVYPVTNDEYLVFVKEHPEWQRSKAIR